MLPTFLLRWNTLCHHYRRHPQSLCTSPLHDKSPTLLVTCWTNILLYPDLANALCFFMTPPETFAPGLLPALTPAVPGLSLYYTLVLSSVAVHLLPTVNSVIIKTSWQRSPDTWSFMLLLHTCAFHYLPVQWAEEVLINRTEIEHSLLSSILYCLSFSGVSITFFFIVWFVLPLSWPLCCKKKS